jgi:hypothetical protein
VLFLGQGLSDGLGRECSEGLQHGADHWWVDIRRIHGVTHAGREVVSPTLILPASHSLLTAAVMDVHAIATLPARQQSAQKRRPLAGHRRARALVGAHALLITPEFFSGEVALVMIADNDPLVWRAASRFEGAAPILPQSACDMLLGLCVDISVSKVWIFENSPDSGMGGRAKRNGAILLSIHHATGNLQPLAVELAHDRAHRALEAKCREDPVKGGHHGGISTLGPLRPPSAAAVGQGRRNLQEPRSQRGACRALHDARGSWLITIHGVSGPCHDFRAPQKSLS